MIVDSMEEMNKLLYKVFNLVKENCRNVMLPENMNITRLITNAQKVEEEKLREHAKDNNKARIGKYKYSLQKSGGGNHS